MSEIFLAASIGSMALGAFSSIMAGQQGQKAAEFNAAVARIDAGTADAAGAAGQGRLQDQSRRRIATAANAAGASGIDPSSGSPLDVMADMAAQGALDAELTRWDARNRMGSALNRAELDVFEGKAKAQAGYLGAVGSVLGGAANLGKAYGNFGQGRVGG